MITRAAAVAGWLVTGHAAIGCLYYLFLQVPESNAWMLAASALIVVSAVWLTGVVDMTALLAFAEDGPMRSALGTALGRAWLIVFPLGLFAAIWWATGEAAAWHTRYSGQIDAEIISRTGWTRTAWLHAAIGWTLAALRWVVGLSLAAALTTSLAKVGIAGLRPRWMRHGLRWKPLLVTAAAIALGLWLPWQAIYWRPAWLPPNWIQPAFAAAKLLVLFVVSQLAWAAVLRAAARQR